MKQIILTAVLIIGFAGMARAQDSQQQCDPTDPVSYAACQGRQYIDPDPAPQDPVPCINPFTGAPSLCIPTN